MATGVTGEYQGALNVLATTDASGLNFVSNAIVGVYTATGLYIPVSVGPYLTGTFTATGGTIDLDVSSSRLPQYLYDVFNGAAPIHLYQNPLSPYHIEISLDTVEVSMGGTGLTTVPQHALLCGGDAATLSTIASASGFLKGATGVAPAFTGIDGGDIATGVVSMDRGGTGLMGGWGVGDIMYATGATTMGRRARVSSSTRQYLGSGSASSPAYSQVAFTELSGTATLAQLPTGSGFLKSTGVAPAYASIALSDIPSGSGFLKGTGGAPGYTPFALADIPSGSGFLKGTGGAPGYTPFALADIPSGSGFLKGAGGAPEYKSITMADVTSAPTGVLVGSSGTVSTATIGASLSYSGTTLNTIQPITTGSTPQFAGVGASYAGVSSGYVCASSRLSAGTSTPGYPLHVEGSTYLNGMFGFRTAPDSAKNMYMALGGSGVRDGAYFACYPTRSAGATGVFAGVTVYANAAAVSGTNTCSDMMMIDTGNTASLNVGVTRAYGLFCRKPIMGSTNFAAYMADATIGASYATTAPPTDGLQVYGVIKNANLGTTQKLVYVDTSSQLQAATLGSSLAWTGTMINTAQGLTTTSTPTFASVTLGTGAALSTYTTASFTPTVSWYASGVLAGTTMGGTCYLTRIGRMAFLTIAKELGTAPADCDTVEFTISSASGVTPVRSQTVSFISYPNPPLYILLGQASVYAPYGGDVLIVLSADLYGSLWEAGITEIALNDPVISWTCT